MAIAKVTGGENLKVVRLYHDREANRGEKNLAQHTAFRQIERLEREMSEGKITEERFVEKQSDILVDFTSKWGNPNPPSAETAEQKAARKARKAQGKAEQEKQRITLIAENGFAEGYTVIFTGTLTKEDSDRIKTLDDPTREIYNKMHTPFKEYLQYHYKTDYRSELKLLTVVEEGEISGLLHTHSMLNTPLPTANREEIKRFMEWIEERWRHYSGATIVRSEIANKVGGVWAFAPYMSKLFFEKHKKGKHFYWATDNLRKLVKTVKTEVPDDGLNELIGKLRSSEDEAVDFIEDCAEMENKRVIDVYFHDALERIDDITFVDLTITNVAREIENGKLGRKRSASDVELYQNYTPLFSEVKHYGENAEPTNPIIPFDTRSWIKENGWVRCNPVAPTSDKRDYFSCITCDCTTPNCESCSRNDWCNDHTKTNADKPITSQMLTMIHAPSTYRPPQM